MLAAGFDPGIPIWAFHNLVGDEFLVLLDHRVVVAPANQTLDGKQGVVGVGYRLALRRLSDQTLAVVRKGHNGGSRVGALGVFQDPRLAAIHYGNAGVGGAKVNADKLSH